MSTVSNQRWLYAGALVSFIGDQLTIIALPWLILRLSNDPLQLGLMHLTLNLPRVLILLPGGALVDRHGAVRVLRLAQYANGVLLLLLGGLTLSGQLQIWHLYLLASGIGLASALAIPAWSGLLAQALAPEARARGAGWLLSAGQFAACCGPLLAGWLLDAGAPNSLHSLGWAFVLDGLSFALSLTAFSRLRLSAPPTADTAPPLLASVWQGLQHFRQQHQVRTLVLYAVCTTMLSLAPLQAALPLLATQFGQGAQTLGLLSACSAAGSLSGMLLYSWRPHWRVRNLGCTVLCIDVLVGLLLLPMARIEHSAQAALLLIAIGACNGYLHAMAHGWLQQSIAPAWLGRVMSIFMFLMMFLPLLSVLAGSWLLRSIPARDLYAYCGLALLCATTLALLFSSLRQLQDPILYAEPTR